jgi:magnesium-transporting ATPase (P-type)
MSGRVLGRAFALQGPAEALVSMAAFFATFLGSGWRPGQPFPEGHVLLAASGAAFAAVILGQAANALACRSESRPVWQVPLASNRLLVPAIGFALCMATASFAIPGFAHLLDQAPPTAAGWIVAAGAPVAVLLAVDTAAKRRARDR